MVCQPVRIALLLGAITAVAVSPARADDKCQAPPSGCKTRTIQVTECVPEHYKEKRTCYKSVCKTVEVDGFRCEVVSEPRERTVVCIKRVPEMTTQIRKVCRTVTDYEERIVNKTCYKTVQETCMKKKLVRHGHWECKEVCPGPLHTCLHNLCNRHCCSDPCDPCKTTCCAPPTRTRKCWVHCPEYVDCPVTVCKKVCYQEPVKCKVAVCRQVWSEEKVNVCTYRCVEEKRVEKYSVCVTRQVPCKVSRTVRECVPYEVEVTCCRMVARTRNVEVQDCPPVCCEPCRHRCCAHNLFGFLHNHGCRHNDCSTGCCR